MSQFRVDRNNYFKKPKDNRIFTPYELSKTIFKFIDKLFDEQVYNKALEPNFGNRSFLDHMVLNNSINKIDANEININDYLEAKTLYDGNDRITLFLGDFLNDFTERGYDLIVCNPPFSMTNDSGKVIKGTWLKFLEKSLSILNKQGVMVFILPSHWCNNTAKHLKQYSKYIKAMFPIPNHYFYKGSIACDVLFISKSLNNPIFNEFYEDIY